MNQDKNGRAFEGEERIGQISGHNSKVDHTLMIHPCIMPLDTLSGPQVRIQEYKNGYRYNMSITSN